MLRRLHELAERKESFAFETTLAARSYAPWFDRLRQQGYEIHLIFVWLRTVDLAIERVAERVRRGGHTIAKMEIRRRYRRGILNLFELYIPLVDTWAIYDNSEENHPVLIVTSGANIRPRVAQPDLWQLLLESRPQK
jgi:predicted ABC-type ATPase